MRLQTASGSETIGAYWIVGDHWEVGLDGFYIGLLLERDVGAVLPKADDRAAGLEMSATAIVEVPSR